MLSICSSPHALGGNFNNTISMYLFFNKFRKWVCLQSCKILKICSVSLCFDPRMRIFCQSSQTAELNSSYKIDSYSNAVEQTFQRHKWKYSTSWIFQKHLTGSKPQLLMHRIVFLGLRLLIFFLILRYIQSCLSYLLLLMIIFSTCHQFYKLGFENVFHRYYISVAVTKLESGAAVYVYLTVI